jgi:hypothetical protein
MKIEAGKYYRRRRGDVVGPLTGVTWCDRTFMAADMTWHENGSYVLGLGHEYDLIAEVYVSDTPPADVPAPETKTLRDDGGAGEMTAEELLRQAMMNAASKPSLEARLDWLEADAAAQREAILRLEQALKRSSLRWIIFGSVCLALALALKVLT